MQSMLTLFGWLVTGKLIRTLFNQTLFFWTFVFVCVGVQHLFRKKFFNFIMFIDFWLKL